MKNIRNKVSAAITTVSVTALNVITTHADGLTFNEGAAKSLVETFFKPLTSFLLWFVPLAALAASIWFISNGQERMKLSKNRNRGQSRL